MNSKMLGEICKPKQWRNLPISQCRNSGFPVYGANGVIGFYDEYNHEYPTIAITCRGATCGNVHVTREKCYITSNAMALDELNEKECKLQYLAQYLRFRGLSDVTTGAAQPQITRANLEKIKIPLPPLDDQKRIAHLLGKVVGLIARRKQHLQQLDDLLKSVFLEMFGPQALGYSEWETVEIKDLAARYKGAMRTGPFGSNLLHSEFNTEGDVAVLGIDNAVQNRFVWGERRFISNDKYQELESYRIYPGDVIVTIMGTIGRSAVIPDDIPLAINTKHLAAITLNKEIANPLFVSYSIHSSPFILNQFKSKNRGAIMSGLNLGLIKETKLKRPPIELQNQFSAIHKRVDAIKSQYQQSLNDLESLYGTLSQKAFKGELDLSRIPLGREKQEMHEEGHEEATTSFESVFPKHIEATLESLNAFNQSASSLKAAQEEAVRFSKLDLPQLDAVRRATEQLAALHTPLHEMKQMAGISEAMEQAQAAIKSMGFENMESISKTAELARTMAINIPKIDLGWLEQQKDLLRNATEPFESMRKAMESINWPSKSLQESIRLQSETAKRLSSSIPDFISWQKQAVDLDAVEFEDEDGAAKRLFTREDVTDIFAYAIEPLSFDSLLHELGELETVDFAGYETIKTSLFDLLDEKQLTQLFDNEMKLLLFSSSEKGPLQ